MWSLPGGWKFCVLWAQDWTVQRSAALVEGRHIGLKSSGAALPATQGLDAQDTQNNPVIRISLFLFSFEICPHWQCSCFLLGTEEDGCNSVLSSICVVWSSLSWRNITTNLLHFLTWISEVFSHHIYKSEFQNNSSKLKIVRCSVLCLVSSLYW